MVETLILINAKSGGVSAAGVEPIISALKEAISGAMEVEIANGDPGELVRSARDCAQSGKADRIVLIGGDGTIAAVAAAIAGSKVALAPLPGGTMNAFSRDLGFDADLMTAISQLPELITRDVDIAYVNDFAFLNNAVFGAYTNVTESREHLRDAEGIAEKAGSITEIIGTIAFSGTEQYKITVDGVSDVIVTNTLMVANNLYAGADMLRPLRSCLDAGHLGLYIAQSRTPLDFVNVLIEAVTGNMDKSELLEISKCAKCTIASESGILEVTVDGEAMELESPVELRIEPKGLRIMAPVDAAEPPRD